jgi:hypothetical protein
VEGGLDLFGGGAVEVGGAEELFAVDGVPFAVEGAILQAER